MDRLALRAGTADLDARRMVRHDGTSVALTPGECRLLGHLAAHDGRVVTRDALIEAWGGGGQHPARTLDTVVRRIRVKIELDPDVPDHLLTAYGDGYRLVLHRPRPLPLPADPGPLFGRDAQVAALIRGAEVPSVQVVTGPPGVGKSRLVLRVAHALAERFSGGVLHSDLAACDRIDQVTPLLARILGADGGGGDLETRVTGALAARGPMLVVIDDAERVAAELPARVTAWVAAQPALRVVIASRVPLVGVRAVVHPLDALTRGDAVALFLHHAGLRDAPWLADPDAVAAVGPLVDQLDRIPLALVLGAGRSSALTPRQLAERLADRFRALAPRRGTDDLRHATLEAAVDLSWELLAPEDQRALAATSVFRGGFDRAAAAAVAGVAEAQLDRLCAASLLVRAGDRFGSYAFVRDHAARRLARDADRARAAEDAHLAWFSAFGDRFDQAAATPAPEDRENVVAAMERAIAHGRADVAAPALWAALAVVLNDAPIERVHGWLTGALALPLPAAHRVHLLARLVALELLLGTGEPDARSAEAVDLARALGDRPLLGVALRARGHTLTNLGRIDEALPALVESRAIADAEDVPVRRVRVAIALGRALLMLGRPEDARDALIIGEQIAQEHGFDTLLADVIRFRGMVAFRVGAYDEAVALFDASLAWFRARGHLRGTLFALESAIELALESGDAARAGDALDELRVLRRDLGSAEGRAAAFNLEGGYFRLLGDWSAALSRFEEAERAGLALGVHLRIAVEGVNIGECLCEVGRIEAGEGRIAAAVASMRQGGYKRGLAEALGIHATALARLGRVDEAKAAIAEAEDQARRFGPSAILATVLARRGLIEETGNAERLAQARAMVAHLLPGAEVHRWIGRLAAAMGEGWSTET